MRGIAYVSSDKSPNMDNPAWRRVGSGVIGLLIVVGVFYPPAGELVAAVGPAIGAEISQLAGSIPDFAAVARRGGWIGTVGGFLFGFAATIVVAKSLQKIRRGADQIW
jgi:hypothetical protein